MCHARQSSLPIDVIAGSPPTYLCDQVDAAIWLEARYGIIANMETCRLSNNGQRLLCDDTSCDDGFSQSGSGRVQLRCHAANGRSPNWRIRSNIKCTTTDPLNARTCAAQEIERSRISQWAEDLNYDLSNCVDRGGRQGIKCTADCEDGFIFEDDGINFDLPIEGAKIKCKDQGDFKDWIINPLFVCVPENQVCIPGDSMMERCDGTQTRIDELKPGDTVKCLKLSTSALDKSLEDGCCSLSFWGHADGEVFSSFVKLSYAAQGGQTGHVSGSDKHFIAVKTGEANPIPGYEFVPREPANEKWILRRFDEVEDNDVIAFFDGSSYVEATVTDVVRSTEQGFFGPVLLENALYIANGIALSPFVSERSYTGNSVTPQDFWYAQVAHVTSTWDGSDTVLADYDEPTLGKDARAWAPWEKDVGFDFNLAFFQSPFEKVVAKYPALTRQFADQFVANITSMLENDEELTDLRIGTIRAQIARSIVDAAKSS